MTVSVGSRRISEFGIKRSQVTMSFLAARATSRSATVVPRIRQLPKRSAATGQVTGAEDLEVMGSGVSGEAQVLPALANDLMDYRGGDASAAKTADREIVAVLHQPPDRLGDARDLVFQSAWFGREEGA